MEDNKNVFSDKRYRVLFVCLGNICRSPAAHGVFQSIVDANGASDRFYVDSAGTYGGHQGQLPDARMRKAAIKRGYALTHRARQVSSMDFLDFDMVIAMDDSNYQDLMHLAPSVEDSRKIKRMADFITGHSMSYIPDPYFMGQEGFELVLDLLEDACGNLFRSFPE